MGKSGITSLIAAGLLAVLGFVGAAAAATLDPTAYSSFDQCDGDVTTLNEFYLASNDAVSINCYYTDIGLNENKDTTFQSMLTNDWYGLIDKSDEAPSGLLSDLETQHSLTTGSFTIDLGTYSSYLLLLKSGCSAPVQCEDQWAVFELTNLGEADGLYTFSFAIDPDFGGALSHGNLYGVVPVPASLPLLVTGLAFAGFAVRRRRRG